MHTASHTHDAEISSVFIFIFKCSNLPCQTDSGVATSPKKPWLLIGGDRRVSGTVPQFAASQDTLQHGCQLACRHVNHHTIECQGLCSLNASQWNPQTHHCFSWEEGLCSCDVISFFKLAVCFAGGWWGAGRKTLCPAWTGSLGSLGALFH